MNINLSDETVDYLVAQSLDQSYKILFKNTEHLKAIENKRSYHLKDIEENEKCLEAMKTVFKYYTGEELV